MNGCSLMIVISSHIAVRKSTCCKLDRSQWHKMEHIRRCNWINLVNKTKMSGYKGLVNVKLYGEQEWEDRATEGKIIKDCVL